MKQYFNLSSKKKKKKKTACLGDIRSLFCPVKRGLTDRSSVRSRGTQNSCYNTGEAALQTFRGFSLRVDMGRCAWLWEVNEYKLDLCSSILFRGEGNGTPLHCSCLENPMDGGAW